MHSNTVSLKVIVKPSDSAKKKMHFLDQIFFYSRFCSRRMWSQLVKTQRHGFMQQDELVCMTNRVLFISVTTIKLIVIVFMVNPCKNHRNSFYSNTCKKLIVIVSIVNSIDCPRKCRGRPWIFLRCRGRPWIFFPAVPITSDVAINLNHHLSQ